MFTSGASTSNELIKIMLAEICYKTSQLETTHRASASFKNYLQLLTL